MNNQNHKNKLLRVKVYCETLYKNNKEKKEEIEDLFYSLLIKIAKDELSISELKTFSEKLLAL